MDVYLHLIGQGLAFGLLTGILYVLIALGLTLIYGILHIVNFAHGEIYMLGAMGVFYCYVVFKLPFAATLVVILLLSLLLGLGVERAFFRPLRGQWLQLVVASVGLSLIIQSLGWIAFGIQEKNVPSFFTGVVAFGGVRLPTERLIAAAVGVGLVGLLIAALVLLPPLGKPYVLHVVIVILINVVYAQALYVIMRMGYLSFGHAGYIALGGYTSALLVTKLAITPWIGFLAGGVVAGIFAWALGAVTLKLRGIYFSLSVFAFAEVVKDAFRAFEVFGGPAGIAGVPRPALLGTRLNTHLQFYYVVLAVALVSLFFLYRLQWTRFGFTLLALRTRETERLAERLGINAARYQTLAVVV